MLPVAEELPADAQYHRTMPAHQCREGGLTGRIATAGDVPLQELPVGETDGRDALEERPELPDHGPRCHICHA